MRIGCLQFAPQVGDANNNLNRADAVLSKTAPDDLDLLVLPELAFSGYNFKSLSDITPFLEPTGAGITSLWARTTALKYNCVVAAGYPEKVDVTQKWPTSPEYYNSAIIVNEDGETIANYRKSHLYYVDESWALEGPDGFYEGEIPNVGNVAMGICMDLNPYKFEAPWHSFEFAFHVLDAAANIVILSMAWLTREEPRHFSRMPKEPDMETLTYWIKRLEPIIRADNDDEIIVVFANRCGVEDDAVYAGTSAVIGIRHGEVNVYGLLGRGEKELLVVDTDLPPYAKLVYRPDGQSGEEENASSLFEPSSSEPPQKSSDQDQSTSKSKPGPNSESSTSSPTSKSAKSLFSQAKSNASRSPTSEKRLRIFGGHVMITHEPVPPAPITGTFPVTSFADTPISPQHFFPPNRFGSPTPGHEKPHSPTSSTRSVLGDALAGKEEIELRDAQPAGAEKTSTHFAPKMFTPSIFERPAPEPKNFSDLLDALRKVNPSQQETRPERPSSPKSRNASRTGRGERSDSVLQRRPPLGTHATTPFEEDEVFQRPESPKSRNASRTRPAETVSIALDNRRHCRTNSTNQIQDRPRALESSNRAGSMSRNQHRNSTDYSAIVDDDRDHHGVSSPDLSKLGVEMMVFEERVGRPRRDSLECHADEDDFVVFHASKKHHPNGEIHANKDSKRSPSRRIGTPKNSPGHAKPRSPLEKRSNSLPQKSPDLQDSRSISRGRRPHANRSPKTTPKSPEYQCSDRASPRGKQHKVAASGDSLRRSPKPAVEEPKGSTERLIRSRRDSNKVRSPLANYTFSSSNGLSAKSPRETSRESENSEKLYASSILTFETVPAPITPDSRPPTPKAMVLAPDWNKDLPDVPVAASDITAVKLDHLEKDVHLSQRAVC